MTFDQYKPQIAQLAKEAEQAAIKSEFERQFLEMSAKHSNGKAQISA